MCNMRSPTSLWQVSIGLLILISSVELESSMARMVATDEGNLGDSLRILIPVGAVASLPLQASKTFALRGAFLPRSDIEIRLTPTRVPIGTPHRVLKI